MPRAHTRKYTKRPSKAQPRHAIWVLVADVGRARLLEAVREDGGLSEIDDVINAEARLRDLDVASDRTGHVNRGADGVGNSFEPRQWHVDRAAEMFAKSLCRRLSAARRTGDVDRIYLVAGPEFLGLLRKNLDRATQRIVAAERATDITRRSITKIRESLPATL